MTRPPATKPRVDNYLLGGSLMLVTTLIFAMADVLTKTLAMQLPVTLVVGMRYLVGLIFLCLTLYPSYGRTLFRPNNLRPVLARSLVLAVASVAMAFALKYMPLAETLAIIYLAPIAVMILAVPLLGEQVTKTQWFFAVMGLVGVLVIVRPGGGLDVYGVIFALANAGLSVVFHLQTRALSQTEKSATLMFYLNLVGTTVFLTVSLPDLAHSGLPDLKSLGLTALLGVLATLGHLIFSRAYREAPASIIAPFTYTHVVWGGILGWMVFNHVPDSLSLLGMVAVVLAGIFASLAGRRKT